MDLLAWAIIAVADCCNIWDLVSLADSKAKSASTILPLDSVVFIETLERLSIAFVILLIIAPSFALSKLILSSALSNMSKALTALVLVFNLTVLSFCKEAEPGDVENKPFSVSAWTVNWAVDANVTWRNIDDTYYVTVYGKNLTDETYRVGSNSVAGLWNFTLFGEPLEYGIEAGYRW